jgi:hypothetical protein
MKHVVRALFTALQFETGPLVEGLTLQRALRLALHRATRHDSKIQP